MAFGREHPVWRSLATALLTLAEETGASNAVVLDDTETVICRGNNVEHGPLDQHSHRVAISDTHALLLWFDTAFDATAVDAAIERHTQEIEGLSEALPFDDPDPVSGWTALE